MYSEERLILYDQVKLILHFLVVESFLLSHLVHALDCLLPVAGHY